MRSTLITTLLVLNLLPVALATDLLVDATGTAGAYRTIGHAMAAARPGDRILVMPGSYPAFQFTTGVSVHGLGDTPSAVQIQRVDYHVSHPTIGYDTALTNVAVGDPLAPGLIAISGNELPPGTFTLDGVEVMGGIFLEGGPEGFSLLLSNCDVDPAPGQGFNGAAVSVGRANNSIEIVDTRIAGWDADPGMGWPAGAALKLDGGCRVRLVASEIRGGDGALAAGLEDGADAVGRGLIPGACSLRLDGQCLVRGGDAAPGGAGGDGVDVSGSSEVGQAGVAGGSGSPDGLAWTAITPQALPVGTWLRMEPTMAFGQGPAAVVTGQALTVAIDEATAPAAVNVSFGIDVPSALFFTLSPPMDFFFGNSVAFVVPESPLGVAIPGVLVYVQGFVLDLATGKVLVTNTDVVRVDLYPEA